LLPRLTLAAFQIELVDQLDEMIGNVGRQAGGLQCHLQRDDAGSLVRGGLGPLPEYLYAGLQLLLASAARHFENSQKRTSGRDRVGTELGEQCGAEHLLAVNQAHEELGRHTARTVASQAQLAGQSGETNQVAH